MDKKEKYCKDCELWSNEGNDFCGSCGLRLEIKYEDLLSKSYDELLLGEHEMTADRVVFKFCPKCGRRIIRSWETCVFCLAPFNHDNIDVELESKSYNQVTSTFNQGNKKVVEVPLIIVIGKFLFYTLIAIAIIYGFIISFEDSGSNGSANIHDYDYTETTIIRDNNGNIIDTEVWKGNRAIEAQPNN